jgi:hypothetical protein
LKGSGRCVPACKTLLRSTLFSIARISVHYEILPEKKRLHIWYLPAAYKRADIEGIALGKRTLSFAPEESIARQQSNTDDALIQEAAKQVAIVTFPW